MGAVIGAPKPSDSSQPRADFSYFLVDVRFWPKMVISTVDADRSQLLNCWAAPTRKIHKQYTADQWHGFFPESAVAGAILGRVVSSDWNWWSRRIGVGGQLGLQYAAGGC